MRKWITQLGRWSVPLVMERGTDGKAYASLGRVMSWTVLITDLFVIGFTLSAKREIHHASLIFNFLEMLTLFVLGYTFAGKTILNKDKFTMFGGTKNGSEQDRNERPAKPAEHEI